MASLSQTKIKVDRLELIARLEGVLKNGDSDYKKQLAKHELTLAKANEEIRARVIELAATPDKINVKARYRGTITLNINSRTEVVEKPRDVACDLRNTIAVLKLSKELNVPLSADQYARYFPCAP